MALLNPNTKTCPIFRTRRDADLTKAIYKRIPILIDENRKQGGNPWGIKFFTMFHQTNDAEHFHPAKVWEKKGYKLEGNVYIKGEEAGLAAVRGQDGAGLRPPGRERHWWTRRTGSARAKRKRPRLCSTRTRSSVPCRGGGWMKRWSNRHSKQPGNNAVAFGLQGYHQPDQRANDDRFIHPLGRRHQLSSVLIPQRRTSRRAPSAACSRISIRQSSTTRRGRRSAASRSTSSSSSNSPLCRPTPTPTSAHGRKRKRSNTGSASAS